MKESSRLLFPSLNGLRAISIIIVIVHHINIAYENLGDLAAFFPLAIDGQFGVNIFFVISGFLITSLLFWEEAHFGKVSLRKFYSRRMLRIFPAYYFLLFCYFILSLAGIIIIGGSSWLTALTFTKYLNWKNDWYTAHFWSLGIEETFYLIWPLLFKAPARSRKFFVFAVILFVPFFKLCRYYHEAGWMYDIWIFDRFDAIAFGCLAAMYKTQILSFLARFSGMGMAIFTSFLLLLLLPFVPILNTAYNLHLGFFIVLFGGTKGSFSNLLITVIMLASLQPSKSNWFRLLNSRLMNRIGILSFSIYLWQQMFLMKTDLLINRWPFNIIMIAGCSMLSYYFLEKPFLKLKKRFEPKVQTEDSNQRQSTTLQSSEIPLPNYS